MEFSKATDAYELAILNRNHLDKAIIKEVEDLTAGSMYQALVKIKEITLAAMYRGEMLTRIQIAKTYQVYPTYPETITPLTTQQVLQLIQYLELKGYTTQTSNLHDDSDYTYLIISWAAL